ncbi:hypothetical protein BJF78_12225 [Pseudonocardia sp. CNS-139]|nr:hypothetical protein BJF78_12225 [Pseudonocardia sp. CNS-139]
MSLTQAQIRRIEYLLGQESQKKANRILSTVESFVSWLRDAASDLWWSIKDVVRRVWDEIVDFFS